jgi:GntR family transcriptional regulator, rspAB operon transcriptional repressor
MPQPVRRRRSRADEIYERLRWMIVALELSPGEVLLEKDLCQRFDVSRTPVREAMLRLAEHGLVVIAPQHATFVSGIDPEAVRQAQFLRAHLEAPVVARLCGMEEVDLSVPRALVLEQQVLQAWKDYAAFVPLDDRFHEALFALAGLAQLWSVIHAKKAHLDRIRFLQAPEPGKLRLLVRQHEAILDAIEARDGSRAEQVVREHVSGALAYVEHLLEKRPVLFDPPKPARTRRPALADVDA